MAKVRIELTDEVVKAITMNCPLSLGDTTDQCEYRCALAGACREYWTDENVYNQDHETIRIIEKN